jgi:hypothetical protein
MDRTNSLICPSCNAPLKSEHRIRVGKKIMCPKCKIAFTVRPEDTERAELAAGANMRRLAIVLVGAFLYLLGGAGLAVYCFHDNVSRTDIAKVQSEKNDPVTDGDGGATSSPAKVPTIAKAGRVSPEDQRKIDNAIAEGVWFLKDHMNANGAWGDNLGGLRGLSVGFASLPGLTLLECGVPADDPAVQNAAKLVRAEAESLGGNQRATYQLALAILFLDRLGEYRDRQERDRGLIQFLALSLIAGQRADGGWSYICPEPDKTEVPQLLTLLGEPRHSLGDWHKALNRGTFPAGGWDNSNTQFAVLALWVAQRHGVPIEKPIEVVEKHFRTSQLHAPPGEIIGDRDNVNLDGSWYYSPGRNAFPWPSMTCSGLLGLAIGHGVTKDPKEKSQKPLDDPAIKAGLAMLAREVDRPGEKRMTDLYFLWSLQRVGVLYDMDLIEGKDWYTWGYKKLLPMQKNDGSWTEGAYYGNNPILNTCFALLFLKRANLVKDLTDKLQLLARMTATVSSNSQPPAKKD